MSDSNRRFISLLPNFGTFRALRGRGAAVDTLIGHLRGPYATLIFTAVCDLLSGDISKYDNQEFVESVVQLLPPAERKLWRFIPDISKLSMDATSAVPETIFIDGPMPANVVHDADRAFFLPNIELLQITAPPLALFQPWSVPYPPPPPGFDAQPAFFAPALPLAIRLK